jgi:cytochrome-b5 reductase
MSQSRPLPPAPREPDLDECCGSGCDPCVFDLYDQRVERWRARCAAIQAENAAAGHADAPDPDAGENTGR